MEKSMTFITCCTRYFFAFVVIWEILAKRIYEKKNKYALTIIVKIDKKYYFHYDFSFKKVLLSLRSVKKIIFIRCSLILSNFLHQISLKLSRHWLLLVLLHNRINDICHWWKLVKKFFFLFFETILHYLCYLHLSLQLFYVNFLLGDILLTK
jgi:hypothetical protein